ncbi:MAG TPA: acyltransferase [Candidatus Obscuribacterales bacterium]
MQIPVTDARTAVRGHSPTIYPLVSVRFFLALLVVVRHTMEHFPPCDYSSPWVRAAAAAVPSFFCLSGFVLTYRYGRFSTLAQIRKYAVARVARILPTYWFCFVLLLMCVPIETLAPEASIRTLSFFANLFLMQSWILIHTVIFGFNAPSYSLSIEVFFYALFPLILATIYRRWLAWLALTAAFAIAITLIGKNPSEIHRLSTAFPPTRLFEFVVGMTTAVIFEKWIGRNAKAVNFSLINATALELISIAALILLSIQFQNYPISALAFGVVILMLTQQRGLVSRLLNHRVLVRLGEATYALFLVHMPILLALKYQTNCGHGIPQLAMWTLCIVLSIIGGLLAYSCIEKPCHSWIVHNFSNRAPEAPTIQRRNSFANTIALLRAFALFVLFVASAYIVFPTAAKPLTLLVEHAQQITSSPVADNVMFGNSVKLSRLYIWRRADGIQVVGYWEAPHNLTVPRMIGVHIVGKRNSIVAQADHAFELGKTAWVDCFFIENAKLTGGHALGLAMLGDDNVPMGLQGKGYYDWNRRRLLLPFPD